MKVTIPEIIAALSTEEGNVTRTAIRLGIARGSVIKRIKRNPELQEAHEAILAEKESGARAIREKQQAFHAKTVNRGTKLSERKACSALIEAEGNVTAAAELLGVPVGDLTTLMKKSQKAQDAKQEGLEYRHQRIADKIYAAASGDETLTPTERDLLKFTAERQIGGWQKQSKVEHSGSLAYDVDSVPEDDETPVRLVKS